MAEGPSRARHFPGSPGHISLCGGEGDERERKEAEREPGRPRAVGAAKEREERRAERDDEVQRHQGEDSPHDGLAARGARAHEERGSARFCEEEAALHEVVRGELRGDRVRVSILVGVPASGLATGASGLKSDSDRGEFGGIGTLFLAAFWGMPTANAEG